MRRCVLANALAFVRARVFITQERKHAITVVFFFSFFLLLLVETEI